SIWPAVSATVMAASSRSISIATARKPPGAKSVTTVPFSTPGRLCMLKPDLRVTIAGIECKNPLTVGSGTYGHHGHFSPFFPVETMGVLFPKTIRAYKWPGNAAPRVLETTAGLHSSVGIPCNSWEHFITHDVPILKTLRLPIVQSIIGRTEDEYVELAERTDDLNLFAGLELNLSCPNLKQGGLDFGYDPDAAFKVVKRVKAATRIPIFAKLA